MGHTYLGRNSLLLVWVFAAVFWFGLVPGAIAYTGGTFNGQPIGTEPEQTVFDYNATQLGCVKYGTFIDKDGKPKFGPIAPSQHIFPDGPARAFYNGRAQTVIPISHATGAEDQNASAWNLTTSDGDLSSFIFNCDPSFFSGQNPDPAAHSAAQWIWSTWSDVGHRVHVFIYNVFNGDNFSTPCTYPGNRLNCLQQSSVLGTSYTSGDSYFQVSGVDPVASGPYKYNEDPGPSVPCDVKAATDVFLQSNVIQTEVPPDNATYYYALFAQTGPPNRCLPPGQTSHSGSCLARTTNLTDPSSWRAWDGSGFNVRFVNPYTYTFTPSDPEQAHICKPVTDTVGSGISGLSLTFNPYLGTFLLVGGGGSNVIYWQSEDLIHWTTRSTLLTGPDCVAVAGPNFIAYPTLIDPAANPASQRWSNMRYRNFEFTGKDPYLYFVRWNTAMNSGSGCGATGNNRDLVRVRLHFP